MPDDVLAQAGVVVAAWAVLAILAAVAVVLLIRGGSRREHDEPACPIQDSARWRPGQRQGDDPAEENQDGQMATRQIALLGRR